MSPINSEELGKQERQQIVMALASTPTQKRKKTNLGNGFRNLAVEVALRRHYTNFSELRNIVLSPAYKDKQKRLC